MLDLDARENTAKLTRMPCTHSQVGSCGSISRVSTRGKPGTTPDRAISTGISIGTSIVSDYGSEGEGQE